MEIPQVQFLDKASMPVVVAVQMCRKLWSSTVVKSEIWQSFREFYSRRLATCTLVVRLLHGWISLVWTDTCALKCVQNNNNNNNNNNNQQPTTTTTTTTHNNNSRRLKQKHTFHQRKSTKKSSPRSAPLPINILLEQYNHSTTTIIQSGEAPL